MKWVIVAIVAAPFVVRMSFWGMCTAKRLLNSGIRLSTVDKLCAYFLLIVGYPADILYNWTVGWVRFGELRKTTYSSRIQYYIDNEPFARSSDEWMLVLYWFAYLNVADPGHITTKQ